jgi:hypothetical protein
MFVSNKISPSHKKVKKSLGEGFGAMKTRD